MGRKYGVSIISGKPTPFNMVTGRYDRFLQEEKPLYREIFLRNMKKAGKEDIMKDMNHQKEMLAARKISGTYTYSDGTKFTYTGSYEKKFLVYLDSFLAYPSRSIMMPAPQIFTFIDPDTGEEKAHIPDCYLQDLNCIINIKSAENQHYRLRDIEREKAQDDAIKKSSFNYIKIYDNQFSKFLEAVQSFDKHPDERILIEDFENFLSEGEVLLENGISRES
jgi:hypothetical protein